MPAPSATWLTKLKVQLKLAIARLRMVQQRDEQLGKTNRRAMAQLLEAGKIESATIRVESIIRADITSELHELLELYCELLLARAGLLEAGSPYSSPSGKSSPSSQSQSQAQAQAQAQCDPGLEEAVKSLIYAAPKTEIKELGTVRTLLAERFGKDFVLAAMENRGGCVSERVVRKLGVEPPRGELVQGYLEEIAKAYGVDWPKRPRQQQPSQPPDFLDDDDDGDDDDDDDDADQGGDDGGTRAAQKTVDGEEKKTKKKKKKRSSGVENGGKEQKEGEEEEKEEVSGAVPPAGRLGDVTSPLTVTPPRMTTDNVHPKVTMGSVELRRREGDGDGGRGARRGEPEGSVPDISDLERRFAALKRR